jgi:hypothetical protein
MQPSASNPPEKDPLSSIYPFVAWLSSYFLLLCYLLWAFLPASVLHYFGITYYPSRYYAVAIPAFCFVFYVFLGIIYVGVNMMNTPDPTDKITAWDPKPQPIAPSSFVKCESKQGIPDIGDIDPVILSYAMSK